MKQTLKQYLDLLAECRDLGREIERMEKKGDMVLHDTVQGSSPHFPYEMRTIPIYGVDPNASKRLERMRRRYQKRVQRCADQMELIADWIETIPDSRTRRVFRMYYVQGMRWREIGKALHLSESAVRYKIHDRYLKECV